MDIPKYFSENIFTVSQINDCVKSVFDNVPVFSHLKIRGEISNFKHHSSGHLYFSLKDQGSVIKAVMFARDAYKLNFKAEDGMKVIAEGRISVYTAQGAYQLYVSSMTPDGKGELYVAFEKLKSRLEAEGLFSSKFKKPLPKFPKKIGVITSPTGAAVQDIINITGRRYPQAKILIYPALVQGDGSVESLLEGVRRMTEEIRPDVVIIGRGGGSIEDLWSFNSEALARAIADSDLPFISAVGHETDFTICDFVSSVRAPTPSGAAELAVPDRKDLIYRLEKLNERYNIAIETKLKRYGEKLKNLAEKRVISSPYGFIDERKMLLDNLQDKANRIWDLKFARCDGDFKRLCEKLNALSPLNVLTRGYSAVYNTNGEVLTSVEKLSKGDTVSLQLSDGKAEAEIKEIITKK